MFEIGNETMWTMGFILFFVMIAIIVAAIIYAYMRLRDA